MNWNRRTATWAGLALLVLTNAVALGGVAYNRGGEPDAVLKLGQRELSPPYVWNDKGENSGLALKLQWRSPPPAVPTRLGKATYWSDHNPGWLNAQKMRALGFDADATSKPQLFDANPSSRHRALPRDVFIVLEFDGPAYQDSVRRAQADVDAASAASAPSGASIRDAKATLDAARLFDTRLFAVDAGLERSALRARYPDRTMYAIVRGRISPMRDRATDDLGGFIDDLSVDEINVPLDRRPVFEGVVARNGYDRSAPDVHFDATVMFGQRAEPWLASAARSQAAAIHP